MTIIHKEVYGQGKPIVLIHGWGMHTGVWRQFAQQLATQHRVICLDLPGHGLSESLDSYTLDQIAKVLVDTVPDATFSILGWSLGATVGIKMAELFPDRINSLILLAGNPRFEKTVDWSGVDADVLKNFAVQLQINYRATINRLLSLQVKGLANSKQCLKQLKETMQERELPSKCVLENTLRLLQTEDLRSNLASLQCPINLILGENDALVPVKASLNIQQIKPECTINIISHASHIPFLSHSSQVIAIINKWYEG